MKLYENKLYREDLVYVATLPFPWDKLKDKKIMISGASGMIGSFLIEVIMYRNQMFGDNCTVIALGRNIVKIKERFAYCIDEGTFVFHKHDINMPLCLEAEEVNYIFHAASNTHPVAYAHDPIGTITTNIIGLYNLLNYAAEHKTERLVFASSVEIYGENRGDTEKFTEEFCGYIDCNTLRAGYPESKRAGESLCQAFIKQKGLDIVIPRLSRTYGPSMLQSDTKAISQFIKKGVLGEDIVLKSEGNQFYSYSYVADAVSGILAIMFYGECGEAYNIADEESDITLKDLAKLIADYTRKKVVFELPDKSESAGYSTATRAVMGSGKLNKLRWKAKFNMKAGIERTIDILQNIKV